MPKASSASKDFYTPKLGFQEGWFEVLDAKVQVFQYPPNKETGEQTPAFLATVLTLQHTDEQGSPVEEEPQEKVLRIEKDLSKMRPGNAERRDDPDPSDLGDELETSGNTVYTEGGVHINANSSWATFVRSLEQKGFKSEILGETYMPDLIGLKAHGVTIKGEKRSINGKDVEPAYFTVDKITSYPYEAKTAKKTAGRATTNRPAAAATTASAAVPAPAATTTTGKSKVNPASADDADAAATAIVTQIASELTGTQRDTKKFYSIAYSRLVQDKTRNRALDTPIQELLKSEDWLIAKGAELDLYSYEDGVFVFGVPTAA